jgi:hypothetical protein
VPASTPLPPTPAQPGQAAMAPFAHACVAAPMTEAVTAAIPQRPRRRPHPSRLARFLGRWTASGHFRSGHTTSASGQTDDDLRLPRETAARNLLLVLAVAALTFLITFALVKWRAPQAPASALEPPARRAAPPLLPTTTPSAVPPAPESSPTASAPLAAPPPSAAPRVQGLLGPASQAPRPHKSVEAPRARPAGRPPAPFKDELLPLSP